MEKYFLLIGSFVALLLSYIFSNYIGVYNQAELSNIYSTYITPVGFTFGIWGLIYLSWITIGIFNIFGRVSINCGHTLIFIFAQILSSFWLVASQYLFIELSLVIILCILGLLISLLSLLRDKNTYFGYVVQLFLAWIFVASIVNIHLLLVYNNMYNSPLLYSYLSVIGASIMIILSIIKWKVVIPSAVYFWATIGIFFTDSPDEVRYISLLSGALCFIFGALYAHKSFLKRILNK